MDALITREMLRNYLCDALPDVEMAMIESRLRTDVELRAMIDEIRGEEERGEHSIGAIWRRGQISCISRDQLGSYLLDALDTGLQDYINFHLNTVGCPYCLANLEDLQKLQNERETQKKRRRRIVDSSAGELRRIAQP